MPRTSVQSIDLVASLQTARLGLQGLQQSRQIEESYAGFQSERVVVLRSLSSAPGRPPEVTNACFVDAKREKPRLSV
jgi:hypothetical protein